ncbi:uncharacterized protein LOC132266097 [Phlebotomus argentipes]|uniref:uncharacterized protein LOC132266097 n=1 Tax=Phlebotomus argentipes TaxID=94469 RepID=UPI002892F95B|nr:uncharacterized protein LOC132266097 [Phlebotomus argentipes]
MYIRRQFTEAQKIALLDFLAKYPKLRSGEYDDEFGRKDAKRLWEKAAQTLNDVPGAKKSWEQWRKIWHDIRRRQPHYLARFGNTGSSKSPLKTNSSRFKSDPDGRKKTPKLNNEQKELLIDFMLSHPELRTGIIGPHFTYVDARREWMILTEFMRKVPGPTKTWKQWRKVWHSMRTLIEYQLAAKQKQSTAETSNENLVIQHPNLSIVKEELDIPEEYPDSQEDVDIDVESNNSKEFENSVIELPEPTDDCNSKEAFCISDVFNDSTDAKSSCDTRQEFQEQQLNLLRRQTEALEAMAEDNSRHHRNFERQMENQEKLMKIMEELMKKLT